MHNINVYGIFAIFGITDYTEKSTGKQHGGSRTSSPVLVADLNDHEIELTVNRYEGVAHIYMYDATHTVMLCDTLQVSGKIRLF